MSPLILKLSDGKYIIHTNDIICLQASSNYTKLFLKGNRKFIMAAKTLKYFQALLPAGNFVRVHSSYLININHVQATHIPKTIFLSQNIEVPV